MTTNRAAYRRRGVTRLMRLLLIGLAFGLAGCTLLPQSTPAETFILPSTPADTVDAPPLDAILRIATPQANEPLKSRRILVMPTANRLKVYQGARWNADAPDVLRDRLIAAFRRSGRLAGVIGAHNPVDEDILLLGELEAFHSEYRDDTPWAVIRLDAQLIDTSNRNLLASRPFSVSIESGGKSIDAVVEAFGQAADELSRQLVAWSLDHIDNYLAK